MSLRAFFARWGYRDKYISNLPLYEPQYKRPVVLNYKTITPLWVQRFIAKVDGFLDEQLFFSATLIVVSGVLLVWKVFTMKNAGNYNRFAKSKGEMYTAKELKRDY